MILLLQVLLLLGTPVLSRRLSGVPGWPGWLSPVVLCYGVGLLMGNWQPFEWDNEVSTTFSEASILLAIPLLLYGSRPTEWRHFAKGSLLSFGSCVLCGVVATVLTAWGFRGVLAEGWQVAGMLVGMYTGGTPNMQAIGLALSAKQETIILVNAADIATGGLYLLFLTSLAPRWYGRWLGEGRFQTGGEPEEPMSTSAEPIHYRDAFRAIALTLGILLLSVGSCWLLFGDLHRVAFIILMLTTLSILAALWKPVQQLRSTFETGEYFLLVFCVAIGLLADFSQLAAGGGWVLAFTAVVMLSTIIMHLLVARWLGIGRDLFLFTSVAALYGPAFIGQIASVTGNRRLILAGIAMGLLGYAVGNYLGIGVAWIIHIVM